MVNQESLAFLVPLCLDSSMRSSQIIAGHQAPVARAMILKGFEEESSKNMVQQKIWEILPCLIAGV